MLPKGTRGKVIEKLPFDQYEVGFTDPVVQGPVNGTDLEKVT